MIAACFAGQAGEVRSTAESPFVKRHIPAVEKIQRSERMLDKLSTRKICRAEIAALCQPSKERGLGALLDDYRRQLEICRRLMAAEIKN